MPESPLTKKLGVKPGHNILLINAPEGYTQMLDPLPDGAELSTNADAGGTFDFVQAFVSSKADIDRLAPQALQALKPGGLLWFSYPKKSAKVKTDINRDVGWDALTGAGIANIAQVSIDDTWSAGRFRPSSDVKSRTKP